MTDIRKSEMELKKSFEKLQSVMSSTIDAISIIVESRDPYTAGHQRRVTQLATAIACELALSKEKIDLIRMGSLIHDIGKIYIPSEILTKPMKLNDIEYAMIKSHPEVARKILKQVDFIPTVVDMVYQHHERIDGSGYPRKLKRDDILIEARILAVADTVEAMATHRPYRPSLGIEKALEEIENQRDILYDEAVADACLVLFREKGFQFKEA
jgi:putative nucleotidyltransferase with HDIG domain